jgi:DNA replication protein DnaC
MKLPEVPANSETAEEKNSTSPSKCEECGAVYETKTFGGNPANINSRVCRYEIPTCDCGEKRRRKEEKEQREQERREYINSLIPKRFSSCKLDGFIPRNEKQKILFRAISEKPDGSYLIIGPYANGKTHLMFAQFRNRMENKVNCYARTTYELIHELQRAELHDDRSEILTDLDNRKSFHLFWDDADKFKVTDWKMEALFSLVDGIYRNNLQLTITSNLNLLELQEKLSPAICRRIDDICTKIEL